MTCERCGYDGPPVIWRGKAYGCPRCNRSEAMDDAVRELIERRGRISIRPRPGTPKRNDRCPCGSGLKFKRCHGR